MRVLPDKAHATFQPGLLNPGHKILRTLGLMAAVRLSVLLAEERAEIVKKLLRLKHDKQRSKKNGINMAVGHFGRSFRKVSGTFFPMSVATASYVFL